MYYVQLFTGICGSINDYWNIKVDAKSEKQAVQKAINQLHKFKDYLVVVKIKIGESAYTLKEYKDGNE